MADKSGQAEIRGIDIDKLAKGFADEEFIFRNFLTVTPTSAREIRWYRKTSGILDSTDTTGITASQIANTSHLALPTVVEQSWTRMTSYVRKYFVESPWISYEDIRDSDPDIIATNVRDLTRAVANQIDQRIYSYLSSSLYLSGAAMAAWGDTGSSPIGDFLSGSASIRAHSYDISNLAVLMHPTDYKNLMYWLISTKGSSVPQFASQKLESGVLLSLLGNRIVVSNNCTEGIPVMIVPQRVATWKSFTPITAATKEEVGIGQKIRIWEEGEMLLTDPNAGYVIKGTAP